MGRTVAELLDSVSPFELLRWQVFDSIEPIGDYGAYLRNGMNTAVLVNAHRGKNTKPVSAEDFMPKRPEPKIVDPKQNSAALRAAFLGVFGDRVVRTDGD